jgi:hypothetical protein
MDQRGLQVGDFVTLRRERDNAIERHGQLPSTRSTGFVDARSHGGGQRRNW